MACDREAPTVLTIFDRLIPRANCPRRRRTMSGKDFIAGSPAPQIGRPLCRVFALAGDTRPERVIAADLLHEEIRRRCAPGRGGLAPNPDASGERRRLIRPQR